MDQSKETLLVEKQPEQQFFVLHDLGYDGISVSQYNNLAEAEQHYSVAITDPYEKGVALIQGTILKKTEEFQI